MTTKEQKEVPGGTPPAGVRILVAGSHTIVREGLKKIISDADGVTVAGEAVSAHALLDTLDRHQYDVVLLDLAVEGRGGLELIRELRTRDPDVPVVVVSMQTPHYDALRALSAGASGYLTRDCAPAELVKAVSKAASGHKYVNGDLAGKLAEYLEAGTPKPLHARLSDREYQVMCLIGSGLSIGDIARQMKLSVKTVSTYRSRILEKMCMDNNLQIIRYVVMENLVG